MDSNVTASHKYVVSSTPHMQSASSTERIMRDVLIGLAPAAIMGVYFFGLRALLIIALSVASSIVFEWLFQKITKRPVTITDYSAAVTGLLLAFNLPVSSPFWMPIVGSFVAIIITKQLFGGLGQNFMNPALAARAFLMASYTKEMTAQWTAPVLNPLSLDMISTATPLGMIKETGFVPGINDFVQAAIGNIGGCIGETCAIALIIGGIYMLVRKVISWHTPVSYLGTVFVLSMLLGGFNIMNSMYALVTGGLMLGAFFMATDYSSSPVTYTGKIIMGIGCGVLTVVIRRFGGYPEGVSYAILIMNLFVPIIDRYLRPRVFGTAAKKIQWK